jgi:hypothetical protein
MSDESTELILGDAAAAASEEIGGPRRFFRRRKKKNERVLTHCENCGAPLTGEYCAKCGQHAIDYRRSLVRVLIDAADSFFNWDTKFLKSIGVLLFKPWKLTNDFNAGRRARYVHPLRLYLLASIAFFLIFRLLNFNSPDAIQFDPKDRAQIDTALSKLAAPESGLSEEERTKVEQARAKLSQTEGGLSDDDRNQMKSALKTLLSASMKQKLKTKDHARLEAALETVTEATPAPSVEPLSAAGAEAVPSISPTASPSPAPKEHSGIRFSDKPDEEKKPFERWLETRVKERVGEDGTKIKFFLETLRSNIPTMMLCCIPLFAFVLKVLYFRQRRFYVEHLVYALHIHTFAYLGVVVIALLAMATERWLPGINGLVTGVLCVALFVQVFLSIRRVYRQSWFFTAFKFFLGSFAYLVILVLAVGATAVVTILLPN